MSGIEEEVAELRALGAMPFGEFKNGYGYKLAQFHLHRALEGVFNIGSHVLSRIPGAVATQYKEIALQLGAHGVLDPQFAETTLVKMAKYRNRLVHFYAEITAEELYEILAKNIGDFTTFLSGIKKLLEHPQELGLSVE